MTQHYIPRRRFVSALRAGGAFVADAVTAPDEGNACGWADLVHVRRAMANGDAYVNVHTVAHPPGEIRGQIR